jgi:hypothetical protein
MTDFEKYIQQENPFCYTGKYLYHYTKASTAIEHILGEQQLAFNPINSPGDPFEYLDCTFGFNGSVKNPVAVKMNSEFNKEVNDYRKNYKIACFCKDRFESYEDYNRSSDKPNDIEIGRGYNHSRMWGQYADKHRGVCIVFNKEKLIALLEQEKMNGSKDLYCEKINYDSVPDIFSDPFPNLQESGMQFAQNHIKDFLFWKDFDYRDENEFRIAVFPRTDNEKNTSDKYYLELGDLDCIEAVILGASFPVCYECCLKNCEHLRGRIYEISWVRGKLNIWKKI